MPQVWSFLGTYFTGRFFALGAFLARPTPHGPGVRPIAPGMCYGSCTTNLTIYGWGLSGVIVSFACNFDRLRGLLSRLSRRNAELKSQEQELRALEDELHRQSEDGACTYFFVNRDFILSFTGHAELPVFQELQTMSGALTTKTINFTSALTGEYATTPHIDASHRTSTSIARSTQHAAATHALHTLPTCTVRVAGTPTTRSIVWLATGGSTRAGLTTARSSAPFESFCRSTRAFDTSGSSMIALASQTDHMHTLHAVRCYCRASASAHP